MMTYPIQLDNGHGETLIFERLVSTPAGGRLEGRNEVQPGAGPPMHVHFKQEEGLTVVAGRLGYQIKGGPPRYAGVGETVVFAPGQAHRFWADGDEVLRCRAYIEPADNIVYFLSEVFRSTRANGGRPSPFEMAYLLHKYRGEFAMVGIPGFVTRVVFPVLRLIGSLSGRFKDLERGPAPSSE
jgi:quercetin dioxygenase-like cupin family protein